MTELTIWGRINSHNVKKVVWLTEEIGLPYVRHDVGLQFGMDDAYLAKNPNALIPTIDDGDLTLWESNTILRYLAAKHGGERWWPADPAVRALNERWMDWHFGYASAQHGAFWQNVRVPPDQRDPDAISRSVEATARRIAVLEAHLACNDYLSQGDFGIGDIPMGCYIHTWFALPIDRPAFPNVRRWYDRLLERPAYREYVAIPLT
ncbi:glutathione S-transferase family protein [Croceicoccus naphthovorans]|uniref:Glutathione S-transferase n=1 Tax=Croceicoccus naphthovorans TaxID=1348774 RepID=A0A0G3XDT4_9SPHN|nr:glutathione S-transferase family protein [Croceicoccus naphthovorans]AKM09700.1 glutathione S-transferase [Croceicoccus naphthovorans]MBB3990835.1 glutathione S-transferase [Croceicoccus naphthovorans]